MRKQEIETWVLTLAEKVKAGTRIEDDRVELKREWPDEVAAARRIAGHANAARSENILWVIGLDDKSGVVETPPAIETSNWWGAVSSHFQSGVVPAPQFLSVPVDEKTVIAIYFETDRAPYLVKNPQYGKKDGGPVEWELPWRVGTSTKSATRGDLLRLLSPKAAAPTIEVLIAKVFRETGMTVSNLPLHWLHVFLHIYVAPEDRSVTIARHKIEALATLKNGANGKQLSPDKLEIAPVWHAASQSPDFVRFDHPGSFQLDARFAVPQSVIQSYSVFTAEIAITFQGDHRVAIKHFAFTPSAEHEGEWKQVGTPEIAR